MFTAVTRNKVARGTFSRRVSQMVVEQQATGPSRLGSVLEAVASGLSSLQKEYDVKFNFVYSDGSITEGSATMNEETEKVLEEQTRQGSLTEIEVIAQSLKESLEGIPSALFRIPLKRVTLSHHRITAIPVEVAQWSVLGILDLSFNSIVLVPVELAKCSQLTALNLAHNSITVLPKFIAGLHNLRMFDLSFNQLRTVPAELFSMAALLELNLSNNLIDSVPGSLVEGLTIAPLRVLDLSANRIYDFPEYFFEMVGLTGLNISSNPKISLSSAQLAKFSDLRALTDLNLSKTNQKAIPQSVFTLSHLTTLSLSGNSISLIPLDIAHLQELLVLDLSDNQIVEIPMVLCTLVKLQHLNVSGNKKLLSLPAHIGRMPLVQLNIANTSITQLPNDVIELTQLQSLVLTTCTVSPGTAIVATLPIVKEVISIAKTVHWELLADALRLMVEGPTAVSTVEMISKEGGFQVLTEYIQSQHIPARMAAFETLRVYSDFEIVATMLCETVVIAPLLQCLHEPLMWEGRLAAVTVLYNIAWIEGTLPKLVESSALQHIVGIASNPLESEGMRALAIRTLGNVALQEGGREVVMEKCNEFVLTTLSGSTEETVQAAYHRLLSILGLHDRKKFQKRGLRILAMDGGGLRGLVLVEMLRALEAMTGKRVHEMFDVIGGTSTGGMMSYAVGVRNYELDKCEQLYKEVGKRVFAGSGISGDLTESSAFQRLRFAVAAVTAAVSNVTLSELSRYPNGEYDRLLNEHIGDTRIIDTVVREDQCKCFAVAAVASHCPPVPYLFRNYCYPVSGSSRYKGSCRVPLWKALRATSAAPTYFSEVDEGLLKLHDGGTVANNPTAIAIHEAKRLYPGIPIDCVVSLGTGATDAISDVTTQRLALRLMNLLVLSATNTDAIAQCLEDTMPSDVYFRFNPVNASFNVELDETADEKLEAMQHATLEYVTQNVLRFQQLADKLKS